MGVAKSGGPVAFLSKSTFNETLTDLETDLPDYDNTTGYVALLAAFRADTTNWIELPEIDQNVNVKFKEETEAITPVVHRHPTSEVVTLAGVESVSFGYPRRDVDDIRRFVAGYGTFSQVAAGASQVAQDIVTLGSGPLALVYHHLCLLHPEEDDEFTLDVYYKVRPSGMVEMVYGHSVTRIPATFKVFAHTGTGFTAANNIGKRIQMTADKSS